MKAAAAPAPRVLALAGDITALIADIRLCTPLRALALQTGWPVQLRSLHDCTQADLASAGVLIVQRGLTRRAWRLMQTHRRRGGAVIYEIDDLLTELPPHISNHAAVNAQRGWVRRCLDSADLVCVSTERLGRELGVDRPLLVPNYALPLPASDLPAPMPEQPVSLLFASMEQLAADFMGPALRALEGPGVQIVAVGPAADSLRAAGVAVRAQPLLARDRFLAFVRALPNPLAVIPLEDSRFAACKSAIKWFDYGEAGIPVLCSDVSPYRDVVRHGVNGGLVANDPASWQAALASAVADGAWRRRVAAAARDDVRRHHTLQHTVQAWQAAIEEALRRRAALQLPAAPWHQRAGDALATLLDAIALRLRQLNRRRLARRQGR